jgi:hypothetical protein
LRTAGQPLNIVSERDFVRLLSGEKATRLDGEEIYN